jgi:hypothetical protein
LIAVAKSDAFVAVFDAKYHYDFWRPITAIRNGDLDALEATPMHPEYPAPIASRAAPSRLSSRRCRGPSTSPRSR